MYDLSPTYLFRWSPVAAWGMIVLAPIGVLGWQLAHVAAVLALRRLRVILPVLLSWPFWADLGNGNTVTFLFVLGALALQGSTGAALGYLGLLLVAPRPLGFPVAAWLLWKRPNLRARFLVMFAVHAGLVAISGWGTAWLRVIGESGVELNNVYNLAPSRLIGALWIPVGLVLALLLAFRNRLGWASLAASPYWFPQYLLMGLFELLKPASPPEAREGE